MGSVGSATEWDNLIYEGGLGDSFRFIVSEETPGNTRVSLFLLPADDDDWAYARKQPDRMFLLDDLIAALERGRLELHKKRGIGS